MSVPLTCLRWTAALWIAAAPLAVMAQSTFEVNFDDLTSRAQLSGTPGQTSAEPEVEAVLTRGGGGVQGEAAIIAGESLEAFGAAAGEAGGSLIAPGRGLRYFTPEVLNPQAGEIRMAFRPSYNGTYTLPAGSTTPTRLYYLFDSGAPSPHGESERVGGIQILIKHAKAEGGDAYMLNVHMALASGEIAKMARPVAATPEEWHTVRLRWSGSEAVLEFDDKVVDRQTIEGPLADFQEFFTVGGSWYGTWPLQGLVDEVRISSER